MKYYFYSFELSRKREDEDRKHIMFFNNVCIGSPIKAVIDLNKDTFTKSNGICKNRLISFSKISKEDYLLFKANQDFV